MYAATFQVQSFSELPPEALCAMVGHMVEALAMVDQAYIMNRRVPLLYNSGVRYSNPPDTSRKPQPWRDVPLLLSSGHGTCHELSAWRIAEARFKEGANVVPYVTCKNMNGGTMFHVQVLDLNSGNIEDPSVILGMGVDPWEPFR